MKILSVAEDNLYNLWQLELQIYHFKKLGISDDFVPIIVGRGEEPSPYAKELSDKKQKCFYYKMGVVDFFSKPDYYPPAIQPFGIYEYLKESKLDEIIFVIDVDVILRSVEDYRNLGFLRLDTIHTSRTSYSRMDYYSVKGETYAAAYDKMFNYLNLDKNLVKIIETQYDANKDENPGGHTFVMSAPEPSFFKKVTKDSLVIHDLLKNHSKEVKEHMSWMAMLWAYYYNFILKTDKHIESNHRLNFCWAVSESSCDEPILHMAGAMKENKEQIFSKLDFMGSSPFNPNNKKKVESYNTNNASKMYVDLVKEYWEHDPVCL